MNGITNTPLTFHDGGIDHIANTTTLTGCSKFCRAITKGFESIKSFFSQTFTSNPALAITGFIIAPIVAIGLIVFAIIKCIGKNMDVQINKAIELKKKKEGYEKLESDKDELETKINLLDTKIEAAKKDKIPLLKIEKRALTKELKTLDEHIKEGAKEQKQIKEKLQKLLKKIDRKKFEKKYAAAETEYKKLKNLGLT